MTPQALYCVLSQPYQFSSWYTELQKKEFVRAVPIAFSAVAALLGTYLYFTSEHWINATAGDLLSDYVSMFICCAAVYAVYKIKEKR